MGHDPQDHDHDERIVPKEGTGGWKRSFGHHDNSQKRISDTPVPKGQHRGSTGFWKWLFGRNSGTHK